MCGWGKRPMTLTVGSVSLRRHDPDQVLRVPTSRRPTYSDETRSADGVSAPYRGTPRNSLKLHPEGVKVKVPSRACEETQSETTTNTSPVIPHNRPHATR